MNQDQTSPQNGNSISDPYVNGQSDAEKLMRRHLQTPGDVITDDELKNLKITGASDAAATDTKPDLDREDPEDTNEHAPVTPWDIVQ